MGWIILGALVVIVICAIVAWEFSNIAKKKGYYEKRWFWYSFLFTVCGYLMIIALPNRNAEASAERNFDELPDL